MFSFDRKEYNYFDHGHNNTRINERAVEMPLVKDFLHRFPECVEIGAVSPYYFDGNHQIYDLTDNHPRSQKVSAEFIDVSNKNLLSISTIEHIGKSDGFCDRDEPFLAQEILQRWLTTADKYLITWPLGYHPTLDNFAFSINNACFIARRPEITHEWRQVSLNELTETDKRYGNFSCANAIIVLKNYD